MKTKNRQKQKVVHSFYNSIDMFINKLQIIIWPDVDAKESYKGFSNKDLKQEINQIIANDKSFLNSTYIIAFIWSLEGKRMLDLWNFTMNYIDDRSGPLGDAKTYKEGILCKDIEIASGSTLLVLGIEEQIRRQSKTITDYLNGPEPILPAGMVNGEDFFDV